MVDAEIPPLRFFVESEELSGARAAYASRPTAWKEQKPVLNEA